MIPVKKAQELDGQFQRPAVGDDQIRLDQLVLLQEKAQKRPAPA